MKDEERPIYISEMMSVDLTEFAKKARLDPLIGREQELTQVIYSLSRRTKRNPVLIGESGVGKTAIVEGLAQRIVKGEVPKNLLDKRLLQLDDPEFLIIRRIEGTWKTDFESRIQQLVTEAADSDVILFITDLHIVLTDQRFSILRLASPS